MLTDFAWNADGTLASRADGDAGAVGTTSFTYDWAKRIAGATLPSGWQSGGGTASFTYRPDGLLDTRKFNSDTNAVTYAYDAAKRPTSLAKTLGTGSLSLSQAWDRVGNITSEGRSITGPTGDAGTNTQSFTYDGLGRLTGSTGLAAGTRTYTWDLDGNRRTKAEGADSYGATYDRTDVLLAVTKNGGTAVTASYDTYGNLLTNPETGTTAGVVTLAYDLADRTTSITPTGGTASTLALDALGRPRTRTTGASVDTYSYAGATNNVVRIANAGGSGTTTDSVVDPSGVRFGTKTGATVAWLLADLHGSVAVGLNQAGTSVSDALRYDGAGMTVATYPGGGSAATKSWKYQGRLDVSASGPSLYDFEARELSPGLGSFTSQDTVLGSATNPRQLNRYVYVAGNPTSFVDPDGHTIYSYDCEDDPIACMNAGGAVNFDGTPASSVSSIPGGGGAGSDGQVAGSTPLSVAPTTGPSACTLVTLTCGVADFDAMSVDERSGWVRGLMDRYGAAGHFDGWFNNVLGILQFAGEHNLMKSGSWESWVDASILKGISDGLALQLGHQIAAADTGAAAEKWHAFFTQRARNPDPSDDNESLHLWGDAEQTATTFGRDVVAREHGAIADPHVERTLWEFGNAYRAALKYDGLRLMLANGLGSAFGRVAGQLNPALYPLAFATMHLSTPWTIDPRHRLSDLPIVGAAISPAVGDVPISYWLTTALWTAYP